MPLLTGFNALQIFLTDLLLLEILFIIIIIFVVVVVVHKDNSTAIIVTTSTTTNVIPLVENYDLSDNVMFASCSCLCRFTNEHIITINNNNRLHDNDGASANNYEFNIRKQLV